MSVRTEPEPVSMEDTTGNCQLVFAWNADRFDHRVTRGEASASSVNDDTNPAWPCSPPLQQLSKEQIGDQIVVLGVGCAGTSHFSVSVEPIENGFRFDWACKTKETPERLCSTYRVIGSVELQAGDHGQRMDIEDLLSIIPKESFDAPGTFRWSYQLLLS